MAIRIVVGWFLYTLGTIDLIGVGIVTLIRSLSTQNFVWMNDQMAFLILAGILYVVGLAFFAFGMLSVMKD